MENFLIVVSDTQLLVGLSDCCRGMNFTPHGLTDGSYVLPWVEERAPSAIILDTSAEGVNALELCGEIAANSSAALFVLTKDGGEMDQLKSEDLGVKAFFSKPLKPAAVFNQIKSLLP